MTNNKYQYKPEGLPYHEKQNFFACNFAKMLYKNLQQSLERPKFKNLDFSYKGADQKFFENLENFSRYALIHVSMTLLR